MLLRLSSSRALAAASAGSSGGEAGEQALVRALGAGAGHDRLHLAVLHVERERVAVVRGVEGAATGVVEERLDAVGEGLEEGRLPDRVGDDLVGRHAGDRGVELALLRQPAQHGVAVEVEAVAGVTGAGRHRVGIGRVRDAEVRHHRDVVLDRVASRIRVPVEGGEHLFDVPVGADRVGHEGLRPGATVHVQREPPEAHEVPAWRVGGLGVPGGEHCLEKGKAYGGAGGAAEKGASVKAFHVN